MSSTKPSSSVPASLSSTTTTLPGSILATTHPHQHHGIHSVASSSHKKKFGKNLNKLVKQPAPPITSIGSSSSGINSRSSTSRSGLLLLSTKKSKSGLLGSKLVSSTTRSSSINSTISATSSTTLSSSLTTGTGTGNVGAKSSTGGGISSKNISSNGSAIGSNTAGNGSTVTLSTIGRGGGAETGITTKKSSVHDALLNAATAEAAGITREKPIKESPAAWGSGGTSRDNDKEKKAQSSIESYPSHGSSKYSSSGTMQQQYTHSKYTDQIELTEQEPMHPKHDTFEEHPPIPTINKSGMMQPDIENSRNTGSSLNDIQKEEQKGDQVAFMAKLAKERAEKRRQEEEERIQEQRERASQRLRDLERKMTQKQQQQPPPSSNYNQVDYSVRSNSSNTGSRGSRWRHLNSGATSEVVLERLGPSKESTGNNIKQASGSARRYQSSSSEKDERDNNTTGGSGGTYRTLYDPSRSYSSLVGGSKVSMTHNDTSKMGNYTGSNLIKKENASHEDRTDVNSGNGGVPSHSYEGGHDSTANTSASSVIQLSSYEDRGRGSRNANSGPRMLFDPKSGSMVAAPVREDSTGVSGKGRRDKLTRGKNTNDRPISSDRDDAFSSSKKSMPTRNGENHNGGKGRFISDDRGSIDEFGDTKYSKHRTHNRRDEITLSRRDKRRTEKDKKSFIDGSLNGYSRNTISRKLNGFRDTGVQGNRPMRRRLPRTLGVLYKRDSKGNLISADECEGDQGYGAHSVPGGRVRNTKGYKLYIQQRQQYELSFGHIDSHGYYGTQQQMYSRSVNGFHSDYDGNGRNTSFGLNRSHFMKNQPTQQQQQQEKDNMENEDADIPSSLRVTRDEKIELLTGIDESPTLQATAAAWAPSEAALAAAAAAANETPAEEIDIETNSQDDVNHDDIDHNKDSDVNTMHAINLIDDNNGSEDDNNSELRWLGFDPTEHMESVIMSPDTETTKKVVEGVQLPDLSLEGVNTVAEPRTPTNAFGSLGPSFGCTTWGNGVSNSVSMGNLSNWDMGSSTTVEEKESTPATSFLSLGNLSANTWGAGGLGGGFSATLSGTPLGNNTEPDIVGDTD